MRGKPDAYEFVVQGHLDAHWANWFPGLMLQHLAGGQTRLCGPVADQAALHGVLNRIRDLGVLLLLVRRLTPCGEELLAREDAPGSA